MLKNIKFIFKKYLDDERIYLFIKFNYKLILIYLGIFLFIQKYFL
jgi:hypothetical protein